MLLSGVGFGCRRVSSVSSGSVSYCFIVEFVAEVIKGRRGGFLKLVIWFMTLARNHSEPALYCFPLLTDGRKNTIASAAKKEGKRDEIKHEAVFG